MKGQILDLEHQRGFFRRDTSIDPGHNFRGPSWWPTAWPASRLGGLQTRWQIPWRRYCESWWNLEGRKGWRRVSGWVGSNRQPFFDQISDAEQWKKTKTCWLWEQEARFYRQKMWGCRGSRLINSHVGFTYICIYEIVVCNAILSKAEEK